jgi:peptidoglycan/xylan/chitin deacetylase (PgdA/CDA1 family)
MSPPETVADMRAPAPLRRLPFAANTICLTFDDGPDPHWTPRILDLLERHHARATFFVIGQLASRFGPLLRQAHAAGHVIGSHGWSHRHPWSLGGIAAHREVRSGLDAIEQILGVRADWFRPPHGRLTPQLNAAAHAWQQRVALWSRSAIDWGPFGTTDQVARRLGCVRCGDIVLLHDGPWLQNRPAATLGALPSLLARMQREGRALLPLPDATLAA